MKLNGMKHVHYFPFQYLQFHLLYHVKNAFVYRTNPLKSDEEEALSILTIPTPFLINNIIIKIKTTYLIIIMEIFNSSENFKTIRSITP